MDVIDLKGPLIFINIEKSSTYLTYLFWTSKPTGKNIYPTLVYFVSLVFKDLINRPKVIVALKEMLRSRFKKMKG